MTANRREFNRLYLNIDLKGDNIDKNHPKIDKIKKLSNYFNIKTKYVGKKQLNDYSGSRPHQNVVLKASRLEYQNVRNISEIFEATHKANEELKADSGLLYLFLD